MADELNISDLLSKCGVASEATVVLRHTPENPLRQNFNYLIVKKPKLFNAYQQHMSDQIAKSVRKNKFVMSFVTGEGADCYFVGLYEIKDEKKVSFDEFWDVSENSELQKLGMEGFTDPHGRTTLFSLGKLKHLEDYQGRLTIKWPKGRLMLRKANKHVFPVQAIHRESMLFEKMPDWKSLVMSWDNLGNLWPSWKDKLREWRGIYLIFDKSDGKSYVGSAYGEDNILGRWLNYAATGDGGNKMLKKRDAQNFSFSILERVSPDRDKSEVIALENLWKERLHTRTHGLNKN